MGFWHPTGTQEGKDGRRLTTIPASINLRPPTPVSLLGLGKPSIGQCRRKDEVNVSFSDTDRMALQIGKMPRATVEDGKGRWEYFGPLVEFK